MTLRLSVTDRSNPAWGTTPSPYHRRLPLPTHSRFIPVRNYMLPQRIPGYWLAVQLFVDIQLRSYVAECSFHFTRYSPTRLYRVKSHGLQTFSGFASRLIGLVLTVSGSLLSSHYSQARRPSGMSFYELGGHDGH